MTLRPRLHTPFFFFSLALLWAFAGNIYARQQAQEGRAQKIPSVLFVGNSFTYGAGTVVQSYNASAVKDLNGTNIGGVPALFKMFANEAGRPFDVSLETSPGKNLDWHFKNEREVIGRSWDYVLLQGYSVLDPEKPGDPTALAQSAKDLAQLFRSKNASVDIRMIATWSRADQTYLKSGYWYGEPIEKMALDVRKGYDRALAEGAPTIQGVIPVGETWNLAIKTAVADPNPYDGITAGQINLWGKDNYHASVYGYYLYALMVFGDITGIDPRSLGKNEQGAAQIGIQPNQALALQQVAYEELSGTNGQSPLKSFKAVVDSSMKSRK